MNRLKRRRRRLALVGLLLLMIGSVVLLQLRIAPTLRRIAENQVVNAASDAIFRAVARPAANRKRRLQPYHRA